MPKTLLDTAFLPFYLSLLENKEGNNMESQILACQQVGIICQFMVKEKIPLLIFNVIRPLYQSQERSIREALACQIMKLP